VTDREEFEIAISAARSEARDEAFEEAEALCKKAAGYYDKGAGSAYSDEARDVGKAMAVWLSAEIAVLRRSNPEANP